MNWPGALKKLSRLSREYMGLARLSSKVLPLGGAENTAEEENRALDVEQLMEKRTRLAGEMVFISQQLMPIWESWPTCLDELSEQERREALECLDAIRVNAGQAADLDKGTLQVFENMLASTRKDLQELTIKNNAINAYRPASLVKPQHSLPLQLSKTT